MKDKLGVAARILLLFLLPVLVGSVVLSVLSYALWGFVIWPWDLLRMVFGG